MDLYIDSLEFIIRVAKYNYTLLAKRDSYLSANMQLQYFNRQRCQDFETIYQYVNKGHFVLIGGRQFMQEYSLRNCFFLSHKSCI